MPLPRRRIERLPPGTCVRFNPCHVTELCDEERTGFMFMGRPFVISASVPENEVHVVDAGGNTSVMTIATTLEEMAESMFQSELMTIKKSDREES